MSRAYVLLNCEPDSEKPLISALQRVDNVTDVHGTLGMYDMVLRIESDSDESVKSTVTERIRRLDKIHTTMTLTCSDTDGIFIPQPDEPAGRDGFRAYVVIHCDRGSEYGILRRLCRIPEVREGDAVFGLYDVICKIESPDYAGLEKVITGGIRSLDHVRTTMTLNVISEQE